MADPTDTSAAGDATPRIPKGLLDGCRVIDHDYRYLYVNDAAVRDGAAARAALLGRTVMECHPGIEQTEMFVTLRRCVEERVAGTLEHACTFPDGSPGWVELRFEPVPDGVVMVSANITARKAETTTLRRTTRALRTLSRCNQALVRARDEQLFMDDVCGLVVEAGGYLEAWIEVNADEGGGRVEVARARAHDPPADAAGGQRLVLDLHLKEDAFGTLTIRLAEPDAVLRFEQDLLAEIAVNLGYGIGVLRDQVEHERTREQLVAAQRLEAVGRLAGGIAHDFNNLLSVIMTYGEFAIEQLRTGTPVRRDVEQMVEAGRQAADLTRQLLAFSRKQVIEPRVTDLNEVIENISVMLRRLLGGSITVEVRAEPDLGRVLADPGHLEQVIMNLTVNARDAMPGGGKLTIETHNVDLQEGYHDAQVSVPPGRYVQMSVADTGVGMSPGVRSRIFEPFFTTKDKGKGTGLGLSMVGGIVKRSGGDIRVDSAPGQGTMFTVYLPRVDAEVVERDRGRRPVPATGGETILLVEDEPAVRKAATRILTSAGYRVLTASDGDEALQLWAKQEGEVDLLLTDVVMPNMSGPILAGQLKKLQPDLKVLFTSGYTDDAIVHHGRLESGTPFLGKPFSIAALTRKVRTVLDSG